MAFSVTLMVAAALLVQSLYRMQGEQLGFTPRGVITFRTPAAPEARPSEAELHSFEAALLDRLRVLPGVRAVAGVNVLPLTHQNNLPTQREAHPEQSIGGMEVRVVTPAYFEAMGIPIRTGRPFIAGDTAGATPVVAISETVAREWWPRGNPLGDRVVLGRFRGKEYFKDSSREVVGVVADTKSVHLTEASRPTIYIPAAQAPWYDQGMVWVVRADLSPGLTALVRQAVADLDPHRRVDRLRTMQEIVASTTTESRFDAWLFGGFAGLALLLTALGVYGLLSFSVARRTGEIGTRMALGASRVSVLALVMRQGLALAAAGLAGAFALTRYLSSLLFGVRSTDPLSYLAVSVLLLLIAALASWQAAARAPRLQGRSDGGFALRMRAHITGAIWAKARRESAAPCPERPDTHRACRLRGTLILPASLAPSGALCCSRSNFQRAGIRDRDSLMWIASGLRTTRDGRDADLFNSVFCACTAKCHLPSRKDLRR